ncbi:MAG: hypothetical protein ACREXX_12790 [Gammaproteobacteria bacterium]
MHETRGIPVGKGETPQHLLYAMANRLWHSRPLETDRTDADMALRPASLGHRAPG